MSATDRYFQFPLCLLAFGENPCVRADHIICYSTHEVGLTILTGKSDKEQGEADKAYAEKYKSKGYARRDSRYLSFAMGADKLCVTPGSFPSAWKKVEAAMVFIGEMSSRYGKDPLVRIRADLLWEVRDNRGVDYREFAIYAAIVSCIGAKGYPMRITREQIQRRMLGYRTREMMDEEISLKRRRDGLDPLSIRQVGYTVGKLHELRFFARARANERQTFYSIRHTDTELADEMLKRRCYKEDFNKERRERNTRLINRIREAKGKPIKANTPIIVDNSQTKTDAPPAKGLNNVHSESAALSTTVSTGVSTLIKTPVIETPLQNPPNKNPAIAWSIDDEAGKLEKGTETGTTPPTVEDVISFVTGLWKGATENLGRDTHAECSRLGWSRDWRRIAGTVSADLKRKASYSMSLCNDSN